MRLFGRGVGAPHLRPPPAPPPDAQTSYGLISHHPQAPLTQPLEHASGLSNKRTMQDHGSEINRAAPSGPVPERCKDCVRSDASPSGAVATTSRANLHTDVARRQLASALDSSVSKIALHTISSGSSTITTRESNSSTPQGRPAFALYTAHHRPSRASSFLLPP